MTATPSQPPTELAALEAQHAIYKREYWDRLKVLDLANARAILDGLDELERQMDVLRAGEEG